MRTRTVAKVATASLALVGALLVNPAQANAASSYHGCPSGAVCLYTNDNSGSKFVQGKPNWVFYSYGGHNISGAVGIGEYVDNQTGAKTIGSYLCTGSNGTGKIAYNGELSGPDNGGPDSHTDVNFTPVNSVKLTKSWKAKDYGQPC